jgi:magnesium transporter
MQKTIMCYNENEVIEGKGSRDDIRNGYNLWIDIVNPSSSEVFEMEQIFNLDNKAVQKIKQKTKKPQVMIFKNHKFTIFL